VKPLPQQSPAAARLAELARDNEAIDGPYLKRFKRPIDPAIIAAAHEEIQRERKHIGRPCTRIRTNRGESFPSLKCAARVLKSEISLIAHALRYGFYVCDRYWYRETPLAKHRSTAEQQEVA
jgi:hypothetical protein